MFEIYLQRGYKRRSRHVETETEAENDLKSPLFGLWIESFAERGKKTGPDERQNACDIQRSERVVLLRRHGSTEHRSNGNACHQRKEQNPSFHRIVQVDNLGSHGNVDDGEEHDKTSQHRCAQGTHHDSVRQDFPRELRPNVTEFAVSGYLPLPEDHGDPAEATYDEYGDGRTTVPCELPDCCLVDNKYQKHCTP